MIKGILTLATLLATSFHAYGGEIDEIERACRNAGGKFKPSPPRINEAQTEQCFDTVCYKIVGDAKDMPLNEGVFEALSEQLRDLKKSGGAIVSFQYDRCFPYEAPNFDQYVIRDGDGERSVSFDVWASICGPEGEKCRLDGDVWVVLGGDGGIGGDGGASGGGRGQNCRTVRYGPKKNLKRVICDGGGSGRGDGDWGDHYIHVEGNTRFRCANYLSVEECIGDDANIIIAATGDARHCVNCSGSSRGGAYGTLSGIAEIAGAVLPPVMGYLGVKAGADAYLGSHEAWAGAASTGFRQCQLMQSNYVTNTYDYIQSNELPDREVLPPECNGYQLNAFAGGPGFMGNGMGGFGNPWGAAGYSPGFIAGMHGPYGMQNPYGYMNGMPWGGGRWGGNGQIGLNLNFPSPYMTGGASNGGLMCFAPPCPGPQGPYVNGGMNGGWGGPGGINGQIGMNGGWGGPGGINGQIGMNGGWGGPGGINGQIGMNGGWNGPTGHGTVPWGPGNGSYWNGTGGWGGNPNNPHGQGWGNIGQSYQRNQYAANQDRHFQRQGLQQQYSQAARNLWSTGYQGGGYMGGGYAGGGYAGGGFGGSVNGGFGTNYGYAPYSPGNVGGGISLGFGYNF